MRHGSLFSGIGGFDLAAEWMGWENVFHCEINKFCQKILKQHWPDTKLYEDITTTDFTEWKGRCDIVTGGFPCQPYSQAGKRKGKADDRHLWPQMLRAIGEIQPTWVVGENVPGLLNWQRGMVLAEIKADLETSGFEVFPPVILPACSLQAPHRRDRFWLVAHINECSEIEIGKDYEKMRGLQIEKSWTKTVPIYLEEAIQKLLPTLKANDYRSGMVNRYGTDHTQQLNHTIAYLNGKTSRLHPSFAEELMGFPIGWTELKPSETQ